MLRARLQRFADESGHPGARKAAAAMIGPGIDALNQPPLGPANIHVAHENRLIIHFKQACTTDSPPDPMTEPFGISMKRIGTILLQ